MTSHPYTSGFEERVLRVDAPSGHRAPSYRLQANRQTILQGSLPGEQVTPDIIAALERRLPQGVQVWQAGTREQAARGLAHPGHLNFPADYRLVAVLPVLSPEAVFDLAQHRPLTEEESETGDFPGWHQRPGVYARPGAKPHSLSVGDVIVVPAFGDGGTVRDILGNHLMALRCRGTGWERIYPQATVQVRRQGDHVDVTLEGEAPLSLNPQDFAVFTGLLAPAEQFDVTELAGVQVNRNLDGVLLRWPGRHARLLPRPQLAPLYHLLQTVLDGATDGGTVALEPG